jgi:Serine kinase of the HPr protein, regulates carbohydrate metabolism
VSESCIALVHATAVARWCPGRGWQAVLLTGSSGVGKSDLALRLMDRGWRLVGDDYVEVVHEAGQLYVTGPESIRERIEIRGLGLVTTTALTACGVVLEVRLRHAPPERMPEPAFVQYFDLYLPALDLDPRPASAPMLIEAALRDSLGHTLSRAGVPVP